MSIMMFIMLTADWRAPEKTSGNFSAGLSDTLEIVFTKSFVALVVSRRWW